MQERTGMAEKVRQMKRELEKEQKQNMRTAVPSSFFEDIELNLSDFILFQSVMRHKEAHECVLSIIMGEPELKLSHVHVEEVILNQKGKRAIRLDAWAVDTNKRYYATEMQNDTDNDDVRRRSRFYQGLIDTPVLKSGRETRYKNLPSTMVTFITQEDIFGCDLARYTFTEQCEEVTGLHLGDGTAKLFLNMSSKNGDPILVSLLQYMKKTQLDNPEITVRDERIRKLDKVVREVEQSEEWEDVKMSILSVGIEKGRAEGAYAKLEELVEKKLKKGKSAEVIAEELEENISVVKEIIERINRQVPQ